MFVDNYPEMGIQRQPQIKCQVISIRISFLYHFLEERKVGNVRNKEICLETTESSDFYKFRSMTSTPSNGLKIRRKKSGNHFLHQEFLILGWELSSLLHFATDIERLEATCACALDATLETVVEV